jgi:hypothetical protein
MQALQSLPRPWSPLPFLVVRSYRVMREDRPAKVFAEFVRAYGGDLSRAEFEFEWSDMAKRTRAEMAEAVATWSEVKRLCGVNGWTLADVEADLEAEIAPAVRS